MVEESYKVALFHFVSMAKMMKYICETSNEWNRKLKKKKIWRVWEIWKVCRTSAKKNNTYTYIYTHVGV